MVQVYVTEIPKTEKDCPFYSIANNKCNIDNSKCCLNHTDRCKHLLDMKFEMLEEGEF